MTRNPRMEPTRRRLSGAGFFFLMTICMVFLLMKSTHASPPDRIIITEDRAFPPYAFLNDDGEPRGITIDIWRLWSKTTGIDIEFKLMDWNDALAAVKNGEADAVGGLFRTPEREAFFDFTGVLIEIPTSIFFHRQIYGVKGFEDLSGFRVGAVKGDSSEELLKTKSPKVEVVTYAGVDEMVRAAMAGDIRIFVADSPVGRFYLAQANEGETFRETSGPVLISPQYSAVRKGNIELLAVLQAGFEMIPRSRINAIVTSWTGQSVIAAIPWRAFGAATAMLLFACCCVILWNMQLRRRVAAATRDLDERNRQLKRSHDETKQSEEWFRITLDSIGDAIIASDCEGRVVRMNSVAETLTGWLSEAAEGLPLVEVFQIVNATTRIPVENPVESVLYSGRVVGLANHTILIARDGHEYKIADSAAPIRDENGNMAGVVLIFRDITEEYRIQEELRQNEEQLRGITENLPGVLFQIYMNPDGDMRFLFIGERANTLFGLGPLPLDTYLERFITCIAPEYQDAFLHSIGLAIAEKRRWEFEGRFLKPEGDDIWFRGVSRQSETENGLLLNGMFLNITLRKRAEEERTRLELQFQQAQKMESVGRLAGGVAHDLNNLLSPILGYGEMLLNDTCDPAKHKESLRHMVYAGERARDLVRQLLAFSRKQVLEFNPIDINDTVLGFGKLLERTIREDVTIEFHLAAMLPSILGDAGQIEQVLMNLAVNAQDAMPDGGVMTIETSITTLDEMYAAAHPGVITGRYVMLSVTDTGKGMDEETQAHLFEPFFTTKDKSKGTGLGLATSYGIVKQHGGSIWAYSEPGRGAVFRIYLPAYDESATSVCATPSLTATVDYHGSETVLLVEDNHMVRELSHAILERHGYTVLVAQNGKVAQNMVEEHTGVIHLLLTDVIMPEMNGYELFNRLNTKISGLKVVYMSGYSEDIIAHRGAEGKKIHFIQKPFSVHAMAAKVREVLDHG